MLPANGDGRRNGEQLLANGNGRRDGEQEVVEQVVGEQVDQEQAAVETCGSNAHRLPAELRRKHNRLPTALIRRK